MTTRQWRSATLAVAAVILLLGAFCGSAPAEQAAATWDLKTLSKPPREYPAPGFSAPGVRVPMLWIVGTNDFAFPLPSVQKSYRLAPGPRTLSIRVRMPHGQGQGADGKNAWASFASARPITKAELNYTCDKGAWKDRKWETAGADLDAAAGKAKATIPDGATQHYFNLIDERGLIVSDEHVTPQAK